MAGHRLGTLEGVGGTPPPLQCIRRERIEGKGSGKWREPNRCRPLQAATQPGATPTPGPGAAHRVQVTEVMSQGNFQTKGVMDFGGFLQVCNVLYPSGTCADKPKSTATPRTFLVASPSPRSPGTGDSGPQGLGGGGAGLGHLQPVPEGLPQQQHHLQSELDNVQQRAQELKQMLLRVNEEIDRLAFSKGGDFLQDPLGPHGGVE